MALTHHSGVVEVLTRKDDAVHITRVRVGNRVLVGVPTAIAQIQSAHERDLTINKAELLMMCPIHYSTIMSTIYGF